MSGSRSASARKSCRPTAPPNASPSPSTLNPTPIAGTRWGPSSKASSGGSSRRRIPFGPDVGELVVSAPWVTKGYLDAPDSNASTIRNGRFYTGDLAGVDADGFLYIKGRTKLLIEVAGHKVDPFEIEELLLTHPSVAEAVVVGIPDVRTGEQRLKAVIVRSAEEGPEALIRYCRERLSSEKVPGVIEFRDEIPKSAAGKVLRGKLMEPA